MKYPYHIEIAGNEYVRAVVMRLPQEIGMVEQFLLSDVQGRGGWGEDLFIGAIEKVLTGEEEYQEVGGNVCVLEIRKDFTRVIDSLADDGIGHACYIETEELKKLILVWLDELEKFKREQGKA